MTDCGDNTQHSVEAVPKAEAPDRQDGGHWTDADEFDPCYCIRCHKRISHAQSDSSGVCDECAQALHQLGEDAAQDSLAAFGVGPNGSPHPICPHCGSDKVTREWVTDWMSKAVDVVTDLTALAIMAGGLAGSSPYSQSDPTDLVNEDAGTVRVMRHKCTACGAHWKA